MVAVLLVKSSMIGLKKGLEEGSVPSLRDCTNKPFADWS